MVGKGWYDVTISSSEREIGYIQFSFMGGIHDAAIGIANCDRFRRNSFIDYRILDADEGGGSTCVGEEIGFMMKFGSGRTTVYSCIAR
jgi:hypothetical protein